MRDYGVEGQLGLEPSMDMYISHLCSIFDEVKRVLRDDGTCWVNLGDTYASGTRDNGNGYDDTRWELSKEGKNCKGWHIQPNRKLENYPAKSLCMIPFRFAIEMVNRGWILRNDIIWHKPNCMPSSAKDRFTVDYEHIFFFTKSKRYYFEQQFESLAESTLPRMLRGVSDNNKWVNGADGQTKHTMSQPRPNIRKMQGTNYGGDGSGLHGHSGYYDAEGNLIGNPQGRNKRAVWSITTKPFSEAHFATFPETLVEPMIKAGCPEFVCCKCGKPREKIVNTIDNNGYDTQKYVPRPVPNDKRIFKEKNMGMCERIENGYTDCGCNAGFDGGLVYDPFMGAGTVAVVAKRLNRHYVGSELNASYIEMANRRIAKEIPQMEFSLAGG